MNAVTFGAPDRRQEAFLQGMGQFIAETPMSDSVVFDQDSSFSYPDWLSRLTLQTS
jgi:hypothetical protein